MATLSLPRLDPATGRIKEKHVPSHLTAESLDARYQDRASHDTALAALRAQAFSVLADGAVADATDAGGTDNTAAFQAAMDRAQGAFGFGGTFLVPPGAYHLSGSVKLRSNVTVIMTGAVIRKYSTSATYSAFEALSNGAQGYGSSVRDVTFEGGTFRGKFGTGATGNAITLHHAQGVTFRKMVWDEAVVGGHAIDLMGCDGVLVDDCEFRGFAPSSNREYTEAIQLDYSLNGAGGSESNVASFDGLPTVNVTVQNSRFLPLTVGGTTYAGPNPLGSHSRVDGRWFENIVFDNNVVEAGVDTSLSQDSFVQLTRGLLHFFCARNVQISRNHFKGTGRATRVIHAYAITTGIALADVQTAGASSQAMTPMPMTGLIVSGNTFEGFVSDVQETMIEIKGQPGTKCRNIKILNNTWRDCWSTPGTPGDKGQMPVYVQDTVGVTLEGNDVRYGRGLIQGFRSSKITVRGGFLNHVGMWAARFSECNDVRILDVDLESFGGGYWTYGNDATAGFAISGGSIIQTYSNAQTDPLSSQPISISGAKGFHITRIRAPYMAGATTLQLVYVYNGAASGRVENNVTAGWGAQTQAAANPGVLRGTGTDIVSQNNLL